MIVYNTNIYMKKYKKISREEYRKGMLEASKDLEFIKRNEEVMKELKEWVSKLKMNRLLKNFRIYYES